MRDATSLADRTTESGPVARFSLSTLVCVLDRALGVGAPTPVSVTGGSWVERAPMTCAARRIIGSRNHHATSAATMATPSSASRANPLRRSEEHTSELQSLAYLVCRLLLEKKKKDIPIRSEEHTSELQSLAYLVCRLLLEEKTTTCANTEQYAIYELLQLTDPVLPVLIEE